MSVLSLSLVFDKWSSFETLNAQKAVDRFLTPSSNKLRIKICVSWTTSLLSCNSNLRTPIKRGSTSPSYSYPLWRDWRHSPHTCSRHTRPNRAAWWLANRQSCRSDRPVVTMAANWPRDAQAAESIILQSYVDIGYEIKCQNHREDRWGFEPTVYWKCSKALKQSSSPAKHLACT